MSKNRKKILVSILLFALLTLSFFAGLILEKSKQKNFVLEKPEEILQTKTIDRTKAAPEPTVLQANETINQQSQSVAQAQQNEFVARKQYLLRKVGEQLAVLRNNQMITQFEKPEGLPQEIEQKLIEGIEFDSLYEIEAYLESFYS